MAVPEVVRLLEEAGRFRFQQRAQRWHLRQRALGWDQALWLGLADALGYSRNREAFGSLAQRLPLSLLQKKSGDLPREALLFGVAGFLPGTILPQEARANRWFRSLWDEWWQVRMEWEQQGLPAQAWSLRGVRPLNRPERRLAVLSLVAEKGVWRKLSSAVEAGRMGEVGDLLGNLSHPFWDQHTTLKSAAGKKVQLLGKDRCQRFWFNVAGPMALASGKEKVWETLESMQTSEVMQSAAVAAVRLLGNRSLGSGGRSLLLKEGLLQIYQDFCLSDFSQCEGCGFPDFVKAWKA
jgi:hypothetical protein